MRLGRIAFAFATQAVTGMILPLSLSLSLGGNDDEVSEGNPRWRLPTPRAMRPDG